VIEELKQSLPARERFIRASMAAFNAHGYADTTSASIAKSVRMSKKTLYQVFSSKESLLVAGLESVIQEAEALLAHSGPEKRGYAVQLLDAYRLMVIRLSGGLRQEIADELPEVYTYLHRFEQRLLERLVAHFELRKVEKQFPGTSKEAAAALFALLPTLSILPLEQARFVVNAYVKGLKRKKKD
jgi:AcrR family transcriptional regulator